MEQVPEVMHISLYVNVSLCILCTFVHILYAHELLIVVLIGLLPILQAQKLRIISVRPFGCRISLLLKKIVRFESIVITRCLSIVFVCAVMPLLHGIR